MYAAGLGAENQLCGGGRYDSLARALGARHDIPAIGWSFGVERLLMLWSPPTSVQSATVLVVPAGDTFAYASVLADALRLHGCQVVQEVRQRSLRASLQYADRIGAHWVAIVGERERDASTVAVRRLADKREWSVELASVQAHGLAGIEEVPA
jgi:histidyl-tRNA synthetase